MGKRLLPWLALLLPSSLAVAGPALEPASIRRVALVVGTNDGGHDRSRLRYAESDAAQVLEVLGRLGGVDDRDARLVLSPDLSTLEAEFDRLKSVVTNTQGSRRVEFLFYYSGHSDEQGLLLGEERFTYAELRARLDALPADVRIAILDSCASGAMTRRKGGKWKPPFMVDDASQVRGHAFLTSSADDEAAQESDRLQASFFTHYLLSGLRGAADVTGDNRVTLNEAYQFAFNETLARTEATRSGAQHPAYDLQLSGTGDLVLTDLRSSTAGLRIAEEVSGRIYVRTKDGRLAAELGKAEGRAVDLGLAAGDYVVNVASEGQMYAALVRLVDGRRTDLTRLQLVDQAIEQTTARGGRHVEIPKPQETPLPMNPPGPAIDIPGVEVPPLPEPARQFVDQVQRGLGDDPDDTRYARTFLHLGAFPGVGLPMNDRPMVAAVSTGLLPGIHRVAGLGTSLVGHIIYDDLRGVAASAGFNVVHGNMWGATAASGFNVVGGHASGLVASGGFNVVGGGEGDNETAHAQRTLFALAGGFNVVGDSTKGVQAAGGFNVADGDLRGVQAAGGFNVAGDVTGVQLSLLNIAGDVTGVQTGLINIATKVKGVQLGLLNVNEDIEGVPIGLLSISKNGILSPEVSMGRLTPPTIGLKIGTRRLYSHLAVGVPPLGWYGRAGLGLRFPFSAFHVDVDVGTGGMDLERVPGVTLADGVQGVAFLANARAMFGWQPFSHLGVFVGVSANAMLPPKQFHTGFDALSAFVFRPDFFAGVSF